MTSIVVNNETKSSMTRVTKEGRQLTYELVVIQQPERARACGSGAKSSADRRPVDPPPVVELKVYEGSGETKKDITFSYPASFFLYITLENARVIAQGRVQNTQTAFPVLTGMPVAGMAYLDRPTPAGYFIFPDLSVRHEGKYRLSFNLFEDPKDPKDADVEAALGSPAPMDAKLHRTSFPPQAKVHFRLEVKSEPFAVFSAKKFPGLKESTTISRVVSEQGCRVRIRRDVRMRRRDTKTRGTYEEYEDETVYARSERYITPDGYKPQVPERPRSISNGSNDVAPTYTMEQPRPAVPDMPYYSQGNFQSLPAAVQNQNGNANVGSHLAFGNSTTPNYAQSSFAAPINQASPLANDYHQYSAAARAAGHLSSLQNGAYNQASNIQHPPYVQSHMPPSHLQQSSMANNQLFSDHNGYSQPTDLHRQSNNQVYSARTVDQYYPVEPRQPAPPGMYQSQGQTSIPGPTTPQEHALPPLKALKPCFEKKYDLTPQNSAATGPMLGIASNFEVEPTIAQSTINNRSGKRAFDAVFDTGHINQPLHGGMRPSTASQGRDVPSIEADDGSTWDSDGTFSNVKLLSYRRADGTHHVRKCPSPVSE